MKQWKKFFDLNVGKIFEETVGSNTLRPLFGSCLLFELPEFSSWSSQTRTTYQPRHRQQNLSLEVKPVQPDPPHNPEWQTEMKTTVTIWIQDTFVWGLFKVHGILILDKMFRFIWLFCVKVSENQTSCLVFGSWLEYQTFENLSSRGGLEVEQWSDNRTLSIWVDQSPLGACMILWYQ